MKSCKKDKGPRYHTDPVARKVLSNMLQDFRTSEGASFCRGADTSLAESVRAFREYKIPELGIVSVGRFKRYMQIDALLKKYRFESDYFTDAELLENTLSGYFSNQLAFSQPMPLKLSGKAVLGKARKIAKHLLGEFPGDEVVEEARFGRKSSIGCPLSLAYLDLKLSDKAAFTGTSETVAHFRNQVLPGDHILSRILSDHTFDPESEQLNFNHLNLIAVPKTWKAYRIITPLTLIGLFYSYGIGRVVTTRLADAGLSISALQGRHRNLVKGFSKSCSHTTADLSAASDSITSELLNRVLPRPWYVALKKCFVRTVRTNEGFSHTASVLPMGNGATFPVETLVFYCIIKAIGELVGKGGVYSVYGDDLIYPSKIHPFVKAVFPQFHFKLNLEKTFVSYPFRESCGADFYRGQDVRPFFLKGESQTLTRVRYEAFLYKVYNGLTARWAPEEIRTTLHWLLVELATVSRGILRVPPTFPDYSGIKVDTLARTPLDLPLFYFEPVSVLFSSSRWYSFRYLVETPAKRVVKATQPYYWLSLQGLTDDLDEPNFWDIVIPQEAKKSSLSWKRVAVKRCYKKNGRTVVKRRTKDVAVVASRTGATVSTATMRTGLISDWI